MIQKKYCKKINNFSSFARLKSKISFKKPIFPFFRNLAPSTSSGAKTIGFREKPFEAIIKKRGRPTGWHKPLVDSVMGTWLDRELKSTNIVGFIKILNKTEIINRILLLHKPREVSTLLVHLGKKKTRLSPFEIESLKKITLGGGSMETEV